MELTDKIKETRKKGIKLVTIGAITALTALSIIRYETYRENELQNLMPKEYKLVFELDDYIQDLEKIIITDKGEFGNAYAGKRNASIYDLLESVNCDSLLDKIEKIKVLKSERDSLTYLESYSEYQKRWEEFYGVSSTILIMGTSLAFCIGVELSIGGWKKLREAKK